MSQIPANLKYTKEHEWLLALADGTALVGITDHAQASLGDVTFVELPATGASFAQGDTFGVVESVKAASDLYLPVAGEILETNGDLSNNPEWVNQDPYGKAWMVKLRVSAPAQLDALLSPADYAQLL